jgi:hypothetical protein
VVTLATLAVAELEDMQAGCHAVEEGSRPEEKKVPGCTCGENVIFSEENHF